MFVDHKGRAFCSASLTAHLRYLKRDGVIWNGERAETFDAGSERADGAALVERCEDYRHHFRFIVSPEDAGEMTDLGAFTDLAKQMEADLGTRLDCMVVDHWNTDNTHVHLVVRGADEEGADLVISGDYIVGACAHALRTWSPSYWVQSQGMRSATRWREKSRQNDRRDSIGRFHSEPMKYRTTPPQSRQFRPFRFDS